jgi:sulfur-carrier protein
MARATLELPSLLRTVLGGRDTFEVEGETVEDALQHAYRLVPALRVHLCDETGKLRQHVLCFHNDVNTRWIRGGSPSLKDGDRITILQAVSGG